MSKMMIRNESTESAKEIWEAVDKAAEKAQPWVKEKIMLAPLGERDRSKFEYKSCAKDMK